MVKEQNRSRTEGNKNYSVHIVLYIIKIIYICLLYDIQL